MSELTHEAAAPPELGLLQTSAVAVQTIPVTYPQTTVRLAQIVPSRTNPRKSFDGPEMDELIASVQLHGILQPVLVRPSILNLEGHLEGKPPMEGYELVCGERRYRAALAAGLVEIPVMVKALRDDECLTIQIIENLQRKDVSALEEAAGYKVLLENMTALNKGTLISEQKTREELVAEIAEQIGKSPRYVYSRMKLVNLAGPVRLALAEGKIEASHADELARLGEKQQVEIFEDLFCEYEDGQPAWRHDDDKTKAAMRMLPPDRIPSVRDLKARLRRDGTELKRAPWKLKKDTLAPLCGPCEFNTANQEGGDPKRPACINTGCFEDKKKRFLDVRIEEFSKAHNGREPIKVSDHYKPKEKDILRVNDWVKASNGSCEFLQDAVHYSASGEVTGVLQVCAYKACQVHFKKGGSAADSAAEKARREAESKAKAARKQEQEIRNLTLAAFLSAVTKLTPEITRTLTTWYAHARHCDDSVQKLISDLCGKPVMDVVKKSPVDTPEFAKAVTGIFASRSIAVNEWSNNVEQGRDEFHASIEALGGSAKKLRAQVEAGLANSVAKPVITDEQLNNLAPVKKAQPKSLSNKKSIAKAFDKKLKKVAVKKPAKKSAKKGGK